jgi:hypothetical protein
MKQYKNLKLLLFGTNEFSIYQQAGAAALAKLDTVVHNIECNSCFSKHRLVSKFQKWFCLGSAINSINNKLLQSVEIYKPDITLIYNNPYIKKETLLKLSKKTWLSAYTNDNPFGEFAWRPFWRNFRRIIPYYDSWHVYRESNVSEFLAAGAKRVGILRSSYLPWLVDDNDLKPRRNFKYDIVFVGHGEADGRVNHIRAILEAGLDVRIFGEPKYWSRCFSKKTFQNLMPIHKVDTNSYHEITRCSKICLAFLSEANRDTYTRRCFEIPAWGGFMLAQRTQYLTSLYEEGIEAEFFNSPSELVGKCIKYLSDDKNRETIAQRGQKKCLNSNYDVISRMNGWLNDTLKFMAENQV